MSPQLSGVSRLPILMVNTSTLPPMGADTWIHVEIIRALDRSRFDVHVACTPGPNDAPTPAYAAISTIPNTELIRINLGREHSSGSRRAKLAGAISDVAAIGGFVRLAWHVRRHRIPIVHTVSRPRDALVCVVLAKVTRTKSIIHMHVAYGSWMGRSLQWAIRQCDALVVISNFVADTLVAGGHRREKMHLAYNAILLDDWKPSEDKALARRELGLPMTGPLVVSVSRLFKEKGTAELLRAIAVVRKEIADVTVVVVGSDVTGGEFKRELEAIIEAEQLHDTVVFAGQRSDIARYMTAADLFAMPSFEEPFGIVFAEAMAMELPVVALNNGGTCEVVDHGRAGLLSEPGDIAGLAAHLVVLLKDPELRRQMGSYGRRQVEERFTSGHLASAMAGIYETLSH